MLVRLLRLLWIPPWVAALYGCLRLHGIDLGLTHSVCGPWGCGPRLEALLGFHGFWTLLFLPVVVGTVLAAPTKLTKTLGWITLLTSVVGLAALVCWDLWNYTSNSGSQGYLLQRAGFTVVTNVDLPLCQGLLAGAYLLSAARWRNRTAIPAPQTESSREPSSAVTPPEKPTLLGG